MPSNLNEKQLKEFILAVNSKQEVLDLFKNLGFTVEEGDDSDYVNISDNDLIEIIFFSSMQDFLNSAKTVSIGKYCTLGISEDFEDWIFAKSVIEDGRKLKKFKFSKTKLSSTPKPIAVKKLLNFKVNDLKSFEDIFKRKDVTKDFYKKFEKLIEALIKKITGIKSDEDKKWYASVIINRILFIYFIQHKELLGNRDKSYLGKHLKAFSKKKKDSYFQEFLRPLFFEGLSKKDKSPAIQSLLEQVPYLNGGLFQEHILEKENPEIAIPDSIFESIFTFLDEWNWHLDEKRDTEENEINPEVIGYIFEQLINQKQMGAYYTKEDITGYISKNTIIPRLLDMIKEKHPEAFADNPNIFQPIFDNPDAFIYESVLHGYYSDFQKKTIRELPANISAGIKDVSKRTDWNKTADEEYALPTETWREVVARRNRYEEIKSQLQKGLGFDGKSPFTTNDLITYNLNIIQFILHAIENGTFDFVKCFYDSLRSITILDPTCGSGAFLLASLNILEDMYEACLDRLEEFNKVGNGRDRSLQNDRSLRINQLRKYQIYKTIILNNLYGVDIMEEAVEICKLRLFLKLISQVERNDDLPNLGIEPLPDIDFNILAGNTLVGFSKMSEVEKAFEAGDNYGLAFYASEIDIIKKHASDLEILHHEFIQYQADTTDSPRNPIRTLKEKIQQDAKVLNEKLNLYLAKLYGINVDKKKDLASWIHSHKPFHWVVEFYGILSKGGFDVIVGNPPYVEYSDIAKEYSIIESSMVKTGNLFSIVTARAHEMLNKQSRWSLIIPISSVSTPRMVPLFEYILKYNKNICVSNYAVRPGKLFVGVDMNLTIIISEFSPSENRENQNIFTTSYLRWASEGRDNLFKLISYCRIGYYNKEGFLLKFGDNISYSIYKKIENLKKLNSYFSEVGDVIFYHSGGRYFRKCIKEKLSNEYKELTIKSGLGDNTIAIMSTSFYYWLWIAVSDAFHVTKKDIDVIPVNENFFKDKDVKELSAKLLLDLYKNSTKVDRNRKDGSKQLEINFHVRLSKPIIDEIDRVLAKHYGFTEEELDYIINYDIKYRMGAEGNEE